MSEFKVSSLLILFLLLVPPVMANYYLLLCYLLFFDLLRLDLSSIPFKIYSICLGLLMIPKAYFVFFGNVNLDVFLNPLLLVVMLCCLLLSERRQVQLKDIQAKTRKNPTALPASMAGHAS